ncbi:MAG TPA: transposase [Geobacteraceae bacterium]
MGRPLRIAYPGAHYHVTSRGNEQKDIFKSRRDREQFLSYLESSVVRYGARIHAYCLMTNHYHLLLETPVGNLPEIMRHINGAYTNYYNTKRKRAGHLFQGRYKAILIEADEYLMELSRYIHLNPVRCGMAEKPESHPWSSYQNYIGQKPVPAWLCIDLVKEHFGSSKNYQQFVEDLLGKEYESPLQRTVASTLLGSEPFVQNIMEVHLDGKRVERDVPAIRELSKLRRIEMILGNVQGALGDAKLEEKIGIYLAHRHSGARLKEIGAYFGKKDSAIAQTSRRLLSAMAVDPELKKMVGSVERKLNLS